MLGLAAPLQQGLCYERFCGFHAYAAKSTAAAFLLCFITLRLRPCCGAPLGTDFFRSHLGGALLLPLPAPLFLRLRQCYSRTGLASSRGAGAPAAIWCVATLRGSLRYSAARLERSTQAGFGVNVPCHTLGSFFVRDTRLASLRISRLQRFSGGRAPLRCARRRLRTWGRDRMCSARQQAVLGRGLLLGVGKWLPARNDALEKLDGRAMLLDGDLATRVCHDALGHWRRCLGARVASKSRGTFPSLRLTAVHAD